MGVCGAEGEEVQTRLGGGLLRPPSGRNGEGKVERPLAAYAKVPACHGGRNGEGGGRGERQVLFLHSLLPSLSGCKKVPDDGQ